MQVLKSTIFNIVFYIWSAFKVIVHIPAMALHRRVLVRGMWRWGRDVNLLLRVVMGIEVEVRGLEHLPAGAALVAAKHQSALDTIIWLHLIEGPAMVMKKELFWIPIYGQMCVKVGMIFVDRKARARAMKKLIGDAKAAIAQGRKIVIFPQGTRAAPRSTVAEVPYQAGVAGLYRSLTVPVVPVATNSGVFWPRRSWLRRPGTMVVEFLPPIEPGLDRKTFMARLQDSIESASARLADEALGPAT